VHSGLARAVWAFEVGGALSWHVSEDRGEIRIFNNPM